MRSSRREYENRYHARERSLQPDAASSRERGGEPLAESLRASFEPRFSHSFADVRVHSDAEGQQVAADNQASAVTLGDDVYLAAGAPAAESLVGAHLFAHELSHVVQQNRFGAGDAGRVSNRADASEREASTAADLVVAGGDVDIASAPVAAAAREEDSWLSRAAKTFSSDTLGLLTGIPAAANDASLLRTVGEATQPGLLSGLGAELNAAGITPFMKAAGPISLVSGISGVADSLSKPRNLQNGADALASANSALAGGVTTMELAGTGLSALGATGAGSALGSAASALGPVGALAGSFAGGYEAGTLLNQHTSVGNHVTDYIGMTSEMFGGDEGRNWLANRADAASENWSQGNYLSAVGNGAQAAGATALGTLGGVTSWIGSSVADGASALGSGISGAAGRVSDAASGAYNWMDRGVRGLYGM